MFCTKSFRSLLIVTATGLMVLLPGCSKKQYTPGDAKLETLCFEQQQGDVKVQLYRLNRDGIGSLWDGAGSAFFSRSRRKSKNSCASVYRMRMMNCGDEAAVLSRDDIALDTLSHQELFSIVRYKGGWPFGLAFGVGAGGVVLGGVLGIGAILLVPVAHLPMLVLIPFLGACAGGALGLPSGAWGGVYHANKCNDTIAGAIKNQVLNDDLVIEPGVKVDTLFFARERASQFTVTLRVGEEEKPVCIAVNTRQNYQSDEMIA